MSRNIDVAVVDGFGDEWSRFDQSALSAAEARHLFEEYFDIFPWHELPAGAVGLDLGCGSGRWAGMRAESFPLAYYRNRSYHVLRTDALDRFGTRLDQRFTRAEVEAMMRDAGLADIVFSPHAPFWCALGRLLVLESADFTSVHPSIYGNLQAPLLHAEAGS